MPPNKPRLLDLPLPVPCPKCIEHDSSKGPVYTGSLHGATGLAKEIQQQNRQESYNPKAGPVGLPRVDTFEITDLD